MGRVILIGYGTLGDLNPLLGLAAGLKARGHETVVVSAAPFERDALHVGAEFAALDTEEAYQRLFADPDVWHPRRGMGVFFRYVASLTEPTVRIIEQQSQLGNTVVVATFQCFGARLAHDVLRVPFCSVLSNPILLARAQDPARNPLWNPPGWLGMWGIRAMNRVMNLELNRHTRPQLDMVRRRRGLAPIRGDVAEWTLSPQQCLALWPAVLAPPQGDWPAPAIPVGFITYDGASADGWEPPPSLPDRHDWLVFTPGSQMTHGREFFRAAIAAAQALGVPTLLVCKDASVLPHPLPDTMWHVPYAPFTWLFARACVVVHHGGIGTVGRALAARVPQLIVPAGFDQFDNGARVARIGAGLVLNPRRLSASALTEAIRDLLASARMRATCAALQAGVAQSDPLTDACIAIEGLLSGANGA